MQYSALKLEYLLNKYMIMKITIFSKINVLLLFISIALVTFSCGSDDPDPVTPVVDSDGDGVPNADDTCPNEAGLATLGGCPDADGDGIADKDDDCPNVAGIADLNGCPDADGDGVSDDVDACPNEAGLANLNGCPDADVDGIADKDDSCPDEAGLPAFSGCPEITEESSEPVGPTLFLMNAGGEEVTINGLTFLADNYFSGSTEAFTNPEVTEIENTELDEIYLTERVSITTGDARPFSYAIPISNGTYTVKLYFAEIFWGVPNPQMLDGGPGSRIFDIAMEGNPIFNSFDLFVAAGGAGKAITKMYDIEVTDGVLNIDFLTVVDRPKVSAIEVFGNGVIDP